MIFSSKFCSRDNEAAQGEGYNHYRFEPSLNEELFFNSRVETNIETFKALCDIIISNRGLKIYKTL